MSSRPDIVGRWLGRYFYDSPEMRTLDDNGVEFDMDLTQTRWQSIFRRFSGKVRDDQIRGVPGDGEIDGTCFGSSFRFTKRLPEFYVGGPEGGMFLHDYLEKLGYTLSRGFAHPPIYYEGSFCDDERAEGIWFIHAVTLCLDAAGSELPFPRQSGRFVLERPAKN